MARLDRSQIGSQGEVLPKLEAHMIPGRKTVLTLDGARQVRGQYGAFLALAFVEFADHEMITNATQEDALIALVDAGRMNDDLDRWRNVRIAFEKRTNENPQTKKPVEKLYAMDPTEQDAAIAEFDKAVAENAGVGTAKKRASSRR
jgi:hypothetical protein